MEAKSFRNDFYKLLNLLKSHTPFAFNRFSDGELFILQDKELILDKNKIKIGTKVYSGPYQKEDFKHYDPKEHSFYRDKLIDSFLHTQKNYFKGIACTCCVGKKNFEWQFSLLNESKNDPLLTWSSLLLNGNYPTFINEMFPVFQDYKTVMVCNEKANLNSLSFIVKDFRVGYNAMINDYYKIQELKNWIVANKISGYLFLFSASTFSKLAIHQLYSEFPDNTYIDIGTSLNAFINMSFERQYLGDYWFEKHSPSDMYKNCIW